MKDNAVKHLHDMRKITGGWSCSCGLTISTTMEFRIISEHREMDRDSIEMMLEEIWERIDADALAW